ncbi:pyruvate, phosphate dikinase/phosphoenolpyruvate synthase regulator [Dethiosulfatarculus sandiegensis]|uniref:Pyruvate, phosphate dikinase regulatory protein n=1 Tax=Dethiosulfatarculus sandiegensis TaxID=1429043 RepID=A0A0D2HNX8_9BACT|nr:pyruvate, phosphate dikinase/phosphoenolpyruvate synthase regulator [Dethiosulfatarculus sandiegensis]KIX12263.1 hypothetical protein X474_19840 [Dethiosulfatarculus sandiegensis]
MLRDEKAINIWIISDATGITGQRVILAVMAQFTGRIKPTIKRHARVNRIKRLLNILDKAEKKGGVVIYSLVSAELRQCMKEQQPRPNLMFIDLMGPLVQKVTQMLGIKPTEVPGMGHTPLEKSFNLAKSIDFTLRHDDGAGLNTLGRADVIITGVSRTSKTSTSILLSCNHNLKVANIPIIFGQSPPEKLLTLKRPQKAGLIISPGKLFTLRKKRYNGALLPGYADMESIRRELTYCRRVFSLIKDLFIIDVTNLSIEEAAAKLAQLNKQREKKCKIL